MTQRPELESIVLGWDRAAIIRRDVVARKKCWEILDALNRDRGRAMALNHLRGMKQTDSVREIVAELERREA